MSDILTTKKERDIMRHALGLNDKNSTLYRNYFSAGPDSNDFEICQGLVKKGLMKVRRHPFFPDFLFYFYVTDVGEKEVYA